MLTLAASDTLAVVADAASKVTCTLYGMELASAVETYKVLDQRQLAAAAATIYTATANGPTFVRTITVVNTDTVARTFQLFRGGTTLPYAITPTYVLAAGCSATYEDGTGWQFTDTTGRLLTGTVPSGAAGAVLAMGNSAVIWNAGTAFPTAKATNDRYWRTDLGMEFYWDGTRWLSCTEFSVDLAITDALQPFTGTTQPGMMPLRPGAFFTSVFFAVYVVTTNDGSNYWNITPYTKASSTAVGAVTTSAVAASTYSLLTATPNVAANAADKAVQFSASKTGSPGSLYLGAKMCYRLIAT